VYIVKPVASVCSRTAAKSRTGVILCGLSSQRERLGLLEQSEEYKLQWRDLRKSCRVSILTD